MIGFHFSEKVKRNFYFIYFLYFFYIPRSSVTIRSWDGIGQDVFEPAQNRGKRKTGFKILSFGYLFYFRL